jgi:hypothetical protein
MVRSWESRIASSFICQWFLIMRPANLGVGLPPVKRKRCSKPRLGGVTEVGARLHPHTAKLGRPSAAGSDAYGGGADPGTKIPSRASCRPSMGNLPSPSSTRRAIQKHLQALATLVFFLGPLIRVARCWKCRTGLPMNPHDPSLARSSIHSSARNGSGHSASTSSSPRRSADIALFSCRIACAGFPSSHCPCAYLSASR